MPTPDQAILIEEVRTPEAVQQAQALRRQIFVEEQGIPAALEQDGLDATAIHVLALDEGLPVATGRLAKTTKDHGVLARIAVLPAYRGRGLGRRIVQHLEHLARREGLRTVTLRPHQHLEVFYRNLGYETTAGSSSAGAHPLITMTKRL